jgi:NADH-quinone oxidoreductase subunit M
MLWLYRRVMFGKVVSAEVEAMERIGRREMLIFAPLTVLVLWFGVYPASLLDVMTSSILAVLDNAASGGALVIAGR